jgi:hypothetical protein
VLSNILALEALCCLADNELNSRVRDEINALAATLRADEKLLSELQLQQHQETFRARFGPEQLGRLDGPDLLDTIHKPEQPREPGLLARIQERRGVPDAALR